MSLATVIPNAAPLLEIRSSHNEIIDSKSFFLTTLFLNNFCPTSAIYEIISFKLNIKNIYPNY